MLITISGSSGSGKSTAARGLSKEFGIPTVDVGAIFREMAKKHGMEVGAFGRYAETHTEIDQELDAEMIRRARKSKKLILQGRLAGWMTKREGLKAVRIWVGASLKTRARRVARREGIPYAKALAGVGRRDRDNVTRYKKTYGLDVNDLSIYDIVVETDNLNIEEVVSSLVTSLQIWLKRKKSKEKKGPRSPKKRLPLRLLRKQKSSLKKRPLKPRKKPLRNRK